MYIIAMWYYKSYDDQLQWYWDQGKDVIPTIPKLQR